MIVSNFFSARKTADQSVTSSTTLASDTELTLPVAANCVYRISGLIQFNLAGVLSGYKFALNGPASPTLLAYAMEVKNMVTTGLVSSVIASAFGSALGGALATSGLHLCCIEGIIENGANAGSVTVQFAQNTSDGSAITIKRGSYLTLIPLL